MAEEKSGFMSRWSRLKREGINEAEAALQPGTVDEQALLQQQEEEAAELEANRKAAEAVDLETLEYESDFAVFLKRGVPELLKKQALRKLWRSNPVLANLDGLNDYEADYGDPKLNTFNSIWQVGRGYLGLEDTVEPMPNETPPVVAGETGTASEPDMPQKAAAMDAVEDEQVGAEPELAETMAEDTVEETPEQTNHQPRVSIRKRLMS